MKTINEGTMQTTGTRSLRDITDEELAVIIDLSGYHGVKQYWNDIVITDVDRHQFEGTIVIDYKQESKCGHGTAKRRFFFNYHEMSYFAAMDEPFTRMTETHSTTESAKMFLWLLAQDFNLLEHLNVGRIDPKGQLSATCHGYIVCEPHPHSMKEWEFFSRDDKDKAVKYIKDLEGNGRLTLYALVENEYLERKEE